MKALLAALVLSISAMGCMVDEQPYVYSAPSGPQYLVGNVLFCDALGCRTLNNATYYYLNGSVVYWDTYLGAWIGPRGYWHRGRYYPGFHPGYYTGYYNRYGHHYSPYHGGYHGGGYHGGGHHR